MNKFWFLLLFLIPVFVSGDWVRPKMEGVGGNGTITYNYYNVIDNFTNNITNNLTQNITPNSKACSGSNKVKNVSINETGLLDIVCATDETGGATTNPAGNDMQVQFNNQSVFGGSNNFWFNETSKTVFVNNTNVTTTVYTIGNPTPVGSGYSIIYSADLGGGCNAQSEWDNLGQEIDIYIYAVHLAWGTTYVQSSTPISLAIISSGNTGGDGACWHFSLAYNNVSGNPTFQYANGDGYYQNTQNLTYTVWFNDYSAWSDSPIGDMQNSPYTNVVVTYGNAIQVYGNFNVTQNIFSPKVYGDTAVYGGLYNGHYGFTGGTVIEGVLNYARFGLGLESTNHNPRMVLEYAGKTGEIDNYNGILRFFKSGDSRSMLELTIGGTYGALFGGNIQSAYTANFSNIFDFGMRSANCDVKSNQTTGKLYCGIDVGGADTNDTQSLLWVNTTLYANFTSLWSRQIADNSSMNINVSACWSRETADNTTQSAQITSGFANDSTITSREASDNSTQDNLIKQFPLPTTYGLNLPSIVNRTILLNFNWNYNSTLLANTTTQGLYRISLYAGVINFNTTINNFWSVNVTWNESNSSKSVNLAMINASSSSVGWMENESIIYSGGNRGINVTVLNGTRNSTAKYNLYLIVERLI